MKIEKIQARMILDSRGFPTTEVDCVLKGGAFGRASTPSGASTGSHEALEIRDKGTLYKGNGVESVLFSLRNVIQPEILGIDFTTQREFDEKLIALDGTAQKSVLGANALLPLSLAFAKACAAEKKIELYEYLRSEYAWVREMSLPTPLINVLNGGKHAAHSTDIQEWMIVPLGKETFAESLELAAKVFYELRTLMGERGSNAVGDEGGFPLTHAKNNEEALELLTLAIQKAGLTPGKDIAFALDVASSEFFEDGTYNLTCDGQKLSGSEFLSWQKSLVEKYPILSIEDGFAEDDFSSWQEATKELGTKIQLVGDDLFVTNVKRIQDGITKHIANAVLIKPNQIGTLTETADAVLLAQKSGYKTIISHRSGETEDTSIAHLAVASGAGQIKTGSLSRTERLSKYNELLRISEKIYKFSPFEN